MNAKEYLEDLMSQIEHNIEGETVNKTWLLSNLATLMDMIEKGDKK